MTTMMATMAQTRWVPPESARFQGSQRRSLMAFAPDTMSVPASWERTQ